MLILAEIADKCLSGPEMIVGGSLVGLVTFVLGLWRRYLAVVPLGYAFLVNWELWAEFHDPQIGPELISEVGERRVLLEYVAFDAPVLFFLLLSLVVWPWAHRALRMARGLCPACAYDLRASVSSGSKRCPECGWEIDSDMDFFVAALDPVTVAMASVPRAD